MEKGDNAATVLKIRDLPIKILYIDENIIGAHKLWNIYGAIKIVIFLYCSL